MPISKAQIFIELIDADAGEKEIATDPKLVQATIEERLISFKFSDDERKKDQMTLTLRNDDFAMLENPIFVKGQKLRVTWGWPGKLKPPRIMIVTKTEGGNPLIVKALDSMQLMDRIKKSWIWYSHTDSEVVAAIAGDNGYFGPFVHIEETKTRSDVVMNYTTDARFIAKLARRNGFAYWVDHTGLHWHKRKLDVQPVKVFQYRKDQGRGDIISQPTFEANLSNGVSKIKVVARDPITKQLWEKFAGPNDTEIETLGLEDEMGDPDSTDQGIRAARMSRVDVRSVGMMTEQEAQNLADAMYREEVNGRYKMKLQTIGDAVVGAKCLVDVYGICQSWDGLYYVKSCEDSIVGNMFTQNLLLEKSSLRAVPAVKKRGQGKKETQTGEDTQLDMEFSMQQKAYITKDERGWVVKRIRFTDPAGGITDSDPILDGFEDKAQELSAFERDLLVQNYAQTMIPEDGIPEKVQQR